MKKTSSSQAKVCSKCGVKKPLSAFLQYAGPTGASYGSVCADCRKAKPEEAATGRNGGTRNTIGLVIDSKSRVYSEIEKHEQHEKAEEEYKEEREEKEEEVLKKDEKKSQQLKKESQHRQSYLDRRPFQGSEKQKENKKPEKSRWASEQFNQRAQGIVESEKMESVGREEQAQKDINFAAPVEDTRVAGKIKFSGVAFKAFTSWVGKSSPIARTLDTPPPSAQPAEKTNDKEKLTDFVEKNWGPKSRR